MNLWLRMCLNTAVVRKYFVPRANLLITGMLGVVAPNRFGSGRLGGGVGFVPFRSGWGKIRCLRFL